MTPQEKAKSIYEDFYHLMPRILSERRKHDTAKLCAIKHLDELAEALGIEQSIYISEIRKEIHKL